MWIETQHGEHEMHYEKNAVTCPHCDHEYTSDEMNECQTDLWALAPREETTDLECPACDKTFFVKGSYRPQYTTAFAEEEL
jgi:uncharacterized Zn-finger protein